MESSISEKNKNLPTLRKILLGSIVVIAALQFGITAGLVFFQLYPRVESLQITLNENLANSIANSTHKTLTQPMVAIGVAASMLDRNNTSSNIDHLVMQQLVDSSEAADTVYRLDKTGCVSAVVYPSTNGTNFERPESGDRHGLDLSRSEVFKSSELNLIRISPIFLSPVSDQPMIAVTAPLHDNGILVMEISLARLGKLQHDGRLAEEIQVLIVDNNGQIIADSSGRKAEHSGMLPIDAMRKMEETGAGLIIVDEVPWFASSARISVSNLDWRVIVMRPKAKVYQPVLGIIWLISVSTALLLGTAAILLIWMTRKFASATEALNMDALSLEKGIIPKHRNFHIKELHELDVSLRSMAGHLLERETLLMHNNEILESRVEERTRHLTQANVELASAMTQLQQTQAELIQAGKMAALGSLVAGVAHEMNTPVGNARLAATSLIYRARQLKSGIESGKISKSLVFDCALAFEEGSSLIDRSLERAGELIRSFKQVAVDQTSNRYREFHLHTIIQENITLLSPRLSKANVTIELRVAGDIEMSGYPGEVGQVITNLVENAIMHAYKDINGGVITVRAIVIENQRVRIQVADNGCGIEADSISRIFDPFFTTRLGTGGSGLGLSIVYNLLSKCLSGSIQVDSEIGVGTCFTVELPQNLAERENSHISK